MHVYWLCCHCVRDFNLWLNLSDVMCNRSSQNISHKISRESYSLRSFFLLFFRHLKWNDAFSSIQLQLTLLSYRIVSYRNSSHTFCYTLKRFVTSFLPRDATQRGIRYSNVSVSSPYRGSNVSVSSRSRHHKLRLIYIKLQSSNS